MSLEFYTLLLAQGILLLILLYVNRISPQSNARLFSPAAWVVLFYLLVFWIPQLFMPMFNYTLIGARNIVKSGQIETAIRTQWVLFCFLAAFTVGYLFLGKRAPGAFRLRPLGRREQRAALLLAALGLVSVGVILIGFDFSKMRSEIVASTTGKMLYAASFWLTLGYMIIAATLMRKRNYSLLLLATMLFAAALLPLGGRGRILWPIVGLIAWAGISGHGQIKYWKLLLAAIFLGIALQALDPIFLYYKGHDTADQAIERFASALEFNTFLYARNFDSFHNLAVIVGEDRVQPSLSYLISGSQEAFMNTYFPMVAKNGVGYPATLPGGLWLAGRWVTIIGGGFAFGLFVGILSRIYRNLRSELGLVAYCIAMPWLCHVGISYLDSYAKMMALIFPGVMLSWLLDRRHR